MSTEANKELVRRWYKDAFEKGDLAVVDEIFAPNYLNHDTSAPPPGWPRGPQGARVVIQTYRSAFPDVHYTIDQQVAEGDKVVTYWTADGTNTGSLMGMPPSGKHIRISGISIERIENGKIAETWVNFDLLGLLQQVGAVPMPQQAKP